jgi:hypothetical protein
MVYSGAGGNRFMKKPEAKNLVTLSLLRDFRKKLKMKYFDRYFLEFLSHLGEGESAKLCFKQ